MTKSCNVKHCNALEFKRCLCAAALVINCFWPNPHFEVQFFKGNVYLYRVVQINLRLFVPAHCGHCRAAFFVTIVQRRAYCSEHLWKDSFVLSSQATLSSHSGTGWVSMIALGENAMCCGHQRIFWHNMLRDAIHDAATAAALNPIKEVCYLIPDNNQP